MNIEGTYINRYGDEYTFKSLDNGDILWEGNFEHYRVGCPNDYSEAYALYYENECAIPHDHTLGLREFKEVVHKEGRIKDLYAQFIGSNTDKMDMIDPAGGPYLAAGLILNGKVIKEFKKVDTGFLIVTEKEE